MPSVLTSQAFELRRYPTVTDHGVPVIDASASPATSTLRGLIQPGTGTTDTIHRNGAEVVKTIWCPPGSDVQHDDRIAIDGLEYFVNGAPEEWRTGVLDHDVIRLSRWID